MVVHVSIQILDQRVESIMIVKTTPTIAIHLIIVIMGKIFMTMKTLLANICAVNVEVV